MKVAALVLALLILVSPSTAAQVPTVMQDAHRTTHVISTRTILGGNRCSGTAIGPHALLTASHCEQPNIGLDRKSTRLNSSHAIPSRMPSSA